MRSKLLPTLYQSHEVWALPDSSSWAPLPLARGAPSPYPSICFSPEPGSFLPQGLCTHTARHDTPPPNSSHSWSCWSSCFSSHVAYAYSCLFLQLPSFLLTSLVSSQLKTWAGVLTLPLPYGMTLGKAPNLTALASSPVTGL